MYFTAEEEGNMEGSSLLICKHVNRNHRSDDVFGQQLLPLSGVQNDHHGLSHSNADISPSSMYDIS